MSEADGDHRVTAPQQDYTTRAVGIGFAVLGIGVLVTMLAPFLLA
ncbi:MAG: hypothetical protein ABEJ57_04860 [Halobacteriaceae archaeon]